MNVLNTEIIKSHKYDIEIRQVDSFHHVFTHPGIDFSNTCLSYSDNLNFSYRFPVTPEEYLRFAQSDYKSSDDRSLINALCQAKRCIDCLVETVLNSLGIDPNKIQNAGVDFCTSIFGNENTEIKPQSLRLFSALGMAPAFLISEVRRLRNIVEHKYQVPEKNEVLKAIELAELLLNNVKAKELNSCGIWISDVKCSYLDESIYAKHKQCVMFKEEYGLKTDGRSVFSITSYIEDNPIRLKYVFTEDEPILYFLLRAMFVAESNEEALKEAIYSTLQRVELQIPNEHIAIKKVYTF